MTFSDHDVTQKGVKVTVYAHGGLTKTLTETLTYKKNGGTVKFTCSGTTLNYKCKQKSSSLTGKEVCIYNNAGFAMHYVAKDMDSGEQMKSGGYPIAQKRCLGLSMMPCTIKGTFVTNEGRKTKNQKPFKVDDNTFVFGGKDKDKWFKMRAVDANGKGIENRYTSEIKKFKKLTVGVWNRANKGGSYSVRDVETGTCDASMIPCTIKGTFVTNEGRKTKNQKPFKVDDNTFVFGGKDKDKW